MNIQRISSTERHLVVGLFNQYRVFYQQPSDEALADRFLQQRLENGESVIYAAVEINGETTKAVGFTQLYPTFSSVRATRNWILNDLYVAENQRGKGVGEMLIRKAMDFARTEGAVFVQLETAVDNHRAQRLYERIGFVKQEPGDDFFLYRIKL